jgi:membrane protein YqaA with SNARE-associated domain
VDRILALLYGLFNLLGPFGLLILGILDSSFLFMPLGNDLLIVALTARKPAFLPIYVAMAAAGSVIGCYLVDTVSRKGGEEGLKRKLSPRRMKFVRKKVETHAAWALALASVMPPPFPFTPFVITAAALQYSRRKLLAVVGISRAVRFTTLGILAITFGPRILNLAKRPSVRYFIVAVVIVSIVGTSLSVIKWVRGSRRKEASAA